MFSSCPGRPGFIRCCRIHTPYAGPAASLRRVRPVSLAASSPDTMPIRCPRWATGKLQIFQAHQGRAMIDPDLVRRSGTVDGHVFIIVYGHFCKHSKYMLVLWQRCNLKPSDAQRVRACLRTSWTSVGDSTGFGHSQDGAKGPRGSDRGKRMLWWQKGTRSDVAVLIMARGACVYGPRAGCGRGMAAAAPAPALAPLPPACASHRAPVRAELHARTGTRVRGRARRPPFPSTASVAIDPDSQSYEESNAFSVFTSSPVSTRWRHD